VSEAGGSGTRYVADVVLRRDENTGLSEKPIQVARPNLRLAAGRRVARGQHRPCRSPACDAADGALELDPGIHSRRCSTCGQPGPDDRHAAPRRTAVREEQYALGMRRERNVGLADFGTWPMSRISGCSTPSTRTCRGSGTSSKPGRTSGRPLTAMLELAGTLMTFADGHPRDLPGYDHNDLTGCFTTLDALVRKLLDTAVPSHHVALPLRRTEPSIYAAALEQDSYFAAPQMYLAVAASQKKEELPRRVPQLLKVSSADQIERLIRTACPAWP
jgi:type VI secretion system protein ImpJ